MSEAQQITIQRLMDRFVEASCDVFDRHFDDAFLADRFMHVEKVMFLVMVLNYVNVAVPDLFQPELAFRPREGAAAAIQEEPSRTVSLSSEDLLHFSLFINEDPNRPDGRWVRALIVDASRPELKGREVVLAYLDCQFIGSVSVDD